jgi:glutamate:Na+ symporter, ESS family
MLTLKLDLLQTLSLAAVVFFLGLQLRRRVGMAVAGAFGEHPLLGVLAGSVTLVGGPATGMAFAPLFEQAGMGGAGVVALSAATAGIVCGGILGGPLGTRLIQRRGLASAGAPRDEIRARFGPAPRAFLVVPIVGAFFIDFANALIITLYLNWLR